MDKKIFCGVTDIIDCVQDDIDSAMNASSINGAINELVSAIDHSEMLIKRLNSIKDSLIDKGRSNTTGGLCREGN